jgi:hypothetical protein
MKVFFLGLFLIIVVAIGGFVYRNALQHPNQQITCPVDAEVCPDGTTVSREGSACTFPACPPPNVSLPSAGIAFAVPAGFLSVALPDSASIAAYGLPAASSSQATIVIREYGFTASSSALATIQQTAIGTVSGTPVPATAFSSTVLGTNRFTIVSIERSNGVVDTAYYLVEGSNVLRFDAIDSNVSNWNNPSLDVSTLPVEAALTQLLSTLQVH